MKNFMKKALSLILALALVLVFSCELMVVSADNDEPESYLWIKHTEQTHSAIYFYVPDANYSDSNYKIRVNAKFDIDTHTDGYGFISYLVEDINGTLISFDDFVIANDSSAYSDKWYEFTCDFNPCSGSCNEYCDTHINPSEIGRVGVYLGLFQSAGTVSVSSISISAGEKIIWDVHFTDDFDIKNEGIATYRISEGVKDVKWGIHGSNIKQQEQQSTPSNINVDTISVQKGNEFTVSFNYKEVDELYSFGMWYTFDKNIFEFIDGKCTTTNYEIFDVTEDDGLVVAFATPASSGEIAEITFKVRDNAEPGDYSITYEFFTEDSAHNKKAYTIEGKITVTDYLRGDINNDNIVNSTDALYLLRHTMRADKYPITQSGDMNGDNYINSMDAIYLLRYTMRPEKYPLANYNVVETIKEDVKGIPIEVDSKEDLIEIEKMAEIFTQMDYIEVTKIYLSNTPEFIEMNFISDYFKNNTIEYMSLTPTQVRKDDGSNLFATYKIQDKNGQIYTSGNSHYAFGNNSETTAYMHNAKVKSVEFDPINNKTIITITCDSVIFGDYYLFSN